MITLLTEIINDYNTLNCHQQQIDTWLGKFRHPNTRWTPISIDF